MPWSTSYLLQLPPAVLETDAKCVDGDASTTQPPSRDDDIIIGNTIRQNHQDLFSPRIGLGPEQVPGCSSDS